MKNIEAAFVSAPSRGKKWYKPITLLYFNLVNASLARFLVVTW